MQWVKYGLPLVPVMSFAVGLYFLLVLKRKVKVPRINVAAEVRRAADKIGPMTRSEWVTGGVLASGGPPLDHDRAVPWGWEARSSLASFS